MANREDKRLAVEKNLAEHKDDKHKKKKYLHKQYGNKMRFLAIDMILATVKKTLA